MTSVLRPHAIAIAPGSKATTSRLLLLADEERASNESTEAIQNSLCGKTIRFDGWLYRQQKVSPRV